MKVKFYTAANLANSLIEAQDNRSLIKLERQLDKAELLIIDELSYLTFNLHHSELLFKIISDRAERQSVIVSTNLKFSEWTTMFENKTMVAALVGRLTFMSHVLNMNSSKDSLYFGYFLKVVYSRASESRGLWIKVRKLKSYLY